MADPLDERFTGRYKAILVDAEEYLGAVVRYIHLNAVEAGLNEDARGIPVESFGIDAIHMAHDPGEVAFRCSKTQMIMISHQRIGKDF